MKLRILTPQRLAFEETVKSVTAPGLAGELTVLDRHIPLFTPLKEGIVRIDGDSGESYFSIGGGYLETDGKEMHILVSRLKNQDEIDEAEIIKAKADAEHLVRNAGTDEEREEAMMSLHRSNIDLKLLSKIRRKKN